MSKAFCIGNGESRKGFDLEQLRPHGKIYGCNALYRDFTPDVLVAVDHAYVMRYTIVVIVKRMRHGLETGQKFLLCIMK